MDKFCKIIIFTLLFLSSYLGFETMQAHAAYKPLTLDKWNYSTVYNVSGDEYIINIPKSGVATLQMKNEPTAKWKAFLYDAQGREIISLTTNKEVYKAQYTKKEVGIKSGVYTVKVQGDQGDYAKVTSSMKLSLANLGNNEQEYNNDYANANALSFGKVLSGNISSGNDVDYYKFSIAKYSELNLNLSNHLGVKWEARVVDGDGKEYGYISSSNEKSNGNENVTFDLDRGNYFVMVKQENSNEYNNDKYQFKLTRADKYIEQEPNNGQNQATLLLNNLNFIGAINSIDDIDYYKYNVASNNSAIEFSIKNNMQTQWNIEILDSKGRTIKKDWATALTSLGFSTYKANLNKGTYYFKVTNRLNAINKEYTVKVISKTNKLVTKNVTVLNAKGAKDTVTIKSLPAKAEIKVFNSKGKLIKKATTTSSKLKLSKLNLGKKAGYIYITVKTPGNLESAKSKIGFSKE